MIYILHSNIHINNKIVNETNFIIQPVNVIITEGPELDYYYHK